MKKVIPSTYSPFPKKRELFIIRVLIILSVTASVVFLVWFFQPQNKGYDFLYWLLVTSILFKLLQYFHEWYHLFHVHRPTMPKPEKQWTVDILTTYCAGEPIEMVEESLRAMVAITYPHTTYLCDEADEPYLRKLCADLGIVHVTRTEKKNAKAGNINNALKQATGELCVIMDPDHVPFPDFLAHVVGFFNDPEVGYVQVVQSYYNQRQSLVAKAAAEQTYQFYGPIMMAMGKYGTAQAIGANCTFRRTALDSIGGHAPGLTEDMHTSMLLHAKGWKSVYNPVVLSKGLVPNTLSAYYKQQIKWARGTFDMLFYVYPGLFRKFTWKQKIHYFTLPLYYLFGLVTLFDILIPVISLFSLKQHWSIDFFKFFLFYTPVIALSLLVRQYSQRWLLEKNERGFHITGGILRSATAWIYIIGFVYTIFKVKVPYIPTPKDDRPRNEFVLGIPALLVCLISSVAIGYGLSQDINPYNFMMAGFAFMNMTIFSFAFLMGQHGWGASFKYAKKQASTFDSAFKQTRQVYHRTKHRAYITLQRGAFALSILTLGLLVAVFWVKENPEKIEEFPKRQLYSGPFYTGLTLDSNEVAHTVAGGPTHDQIQLVELGDEQLGEPLPIEQWEALRKDGKYGLFRMFLHVVPTDAQDTIPKDIISQVAAGYLDKQLKATATQISRFPYPVFIQLEFADSLTQKRMHSGKRKDVVAFMDAWEKIVGLIRREGVEQVTWVLRVDPTLAQYGYLPSSEFVDWVRFVPNRGEEKSITFTSFQVQYQQIRPYVTILHRPVLLSGWEPANEADAQPLLGFLENRPEVRGVMLKKKGAELLAGAIRAHFADEYPDDLPTRPNAPWYFVPTSKPDQTKEMIVQQVVNSPRKSSITRIGSDFQLMVDQEPFYIRGICYNPEHSWRDNHLPLTREQLEKDFQSIKAMGGNTIRRYAPKIYDYNILREAAEQDVKVLYGFWFDPETDFIRDQGEVQEYFEEVHSKVEEFKHEPAVMAWGVGNETWGLLKKFYGKPYLTELRMAYLNMVQQMAVDIKQIDPTRVVFTAMEHTRFQTEAELANYHRFAPAVDIMAVNSYYEEQISQLGNISQKFCPDRPYLVSEFGPKGYWDENFSDWIFDSVVVERSDWSKARFYADQWEQFIQPRQGQNLGGLAFCWRDRYEGSASWFGITDELTERKPSYYTLREAWTGEKSPEFPDVSIVFPVTSDHTQKIMEFHLFAPTGIPAGWTCEWKLYQDLYMKKLDILKVSKSKKSVKIAFADIPKDAEDIRLYAYLRDGKGNVVTASAPVALTAFK